MKKRHILKIIDVYVQAVNEANANLLESLFWVDDPHFSEVEDHIPTPFGRDVFMDIGNWIRTHGTPGNNQRFYNTTVYILTPEVAYSVSMQEQYRSNTTSRVTLVYLKKGDEWRIIHGHFSNVPSS